MRNPIIAALAGAAFLVGTSLAIVPADAQTVVIKRGHGHHHGHVHGPRKKKVIVVHERRHHGWRHHQHVRGRGHMHHNRGTVGISIR